MMKCPENLSQNKGKLEGVLISSQMHRAGETDVPQEGADRSCQLSKRVWLGRKI